MWNCLTLKLAIVPSQVIYLLIFFLFDRSEWQKQQKQRFSIFWLVFKYYSSHGRKEYETTQRLLTPSVYPQVEQGLGPVSTSHSVHLQETKYKWSLASNTDTHLWHMGVLRGILTTAPNTHSTIGISDHSNLCIWVGLLCSIPSPQIQWLWL